MNISKDLSKKELVAILEVIESARNCDDERDVQNLVIRAKDLLGADYCICGIGKISPDAILEPSTIINGNYPEEWVDMYKRERLYTIDPVVKFHSRFVMTQLWSDTFKFYNDKETIKFLNSASDFGLKNGIASGMYDTEIKNASIFSFASNHQRFSLHHKKVMDIVIPHLHNALAGIYKIERPVNMDTIPDVIGGGQIIRYM